MAQKNGKTKRAPTRIVSAAKRSSSAERITTPARSNKPMAIEGASAKAIQYIDEALASGPVKMRQLLNIIRSVLQDLRPEKQKEA